MKTALRFLVLLAAAWLALACGGDDEPAGGVAGTGGAPDAAAGTGGAGGSAGSAGVAGTGGTSGSAGSGGSAGAASGARIEIDPPGLVLSPSDSAPLRARVLDATGALLTTASVDWEANANAVTLSAAAGESTTVTAGAAIASAQIVARIGNLQSAPVTIAVARPVAGARVVRDDEVLSDVQAIDSSPPGAVGSRLHAVIAGAAPAPGQILVGVGKPVAGKVVASAPAVPGNDVTFEVVPLDELFAELSIDQRYDARFLTPAYPTAAAASATTAADGTVTEAFVLDLPAYTPPAAVHAEDTAALERNFRLGPMYCELDASIAPSISGSQITTTIQRNVQSITGNLSIGPAGSSIKVLAEGSIGVQVNGPLRLNSGLQGSLLCQAPLVTWPIPVPPPVAVVVVPTLVAGARVSASGKIELNTLELVIDARATQPLKLGFEVTPAGTFNNLSELDPSRIESELHPELRNTTLDSPVRVDVAVGGGLYAQAAVTNIAYAFVASLHDQYPYLSLLDLESGLKANLRLGTAADQANDPAYKAGYDIKFATRFGLGKDARTVLRMLSRLLALGSALVPDLTHEKDLFSSPLGEANTSLTTYNQGERVMFEIALDPESATPPLLGYYNVRRVEVWRKGEGGAAEMLVGRDALAGETKFRFDWGADRIGVRDTLIAVVEPVFGEGFDFKLGPVAGWTGTQQWGGPRNQAASMLTIDAEGNLALAGNTLDPLPAVASNGGADLLWQKFDALGQAAENNLVGGLGDDLPIAMARSSDGYDYVAGYSYGGDLEGTGAPASVFAWLAKLDARGQKVWVRQWASREQERATSVAIGRNGEIYVGGSTGIALTGSAFTSAICPTLPPDDRPEYDCGDVVLSRFGPGGNLLYRRIEERKGWQLRSKVAVDTGGNVLLVAQTLGNVETDEVVGNEDPALSVNDPQRYKWGTGLFAFDQSSGDVRSHRYIKVDEEDLIASEVVFDGTGNATLAGYTTGAFPGFDNQGGADAVVIQVSSLGAPSWVRMFGTPATDSASGLCVLPSGDVYVTGNTGGSLFDASRGASDAFLMRLTQASTTVWSRQFGGPANDFGIAVAFDRNGSVFVAGGSDGKLAPSLTSGFGGLDAFAAKFSADGTSQ
jgi:hypothetical protein